MLSRLPWTLCNIHHVAQIYASRLIDRVIEFVDSVRYVLEKPEFTETTLCIARNWVRKGD